MEFNYNEYLSGTYSFPLIKGIITLIFLIFFVGYSIYCIKVKGKLLPFNYLSVLIAFFLLFTSAKQLEYGFVLNGENPLIYETVSGTIEEIEETSFSPRYYYMDKPVHPSIIMVAGQKYYIMTIGDFEIGDYVGIDYLEKSTIVLRIDNLE